MSTEELMKAVEYLRSRCPPASLAIAQVVGCIENLEAENARHIKMLADCFRMAGADPDDNGDWRIAPSALRAVTDLRRDYDDVLDWHTQCMETESRLAAANALLRDIKDWDVDCVVSADRDVLRQLFRLPLALRQSIQSHLQGAGDEAV